MDTDDVVHEVEQEEEAGRILPNEPDADDGHGMPRHGDRNLHVPSTPPKL